MVYEILINELAPERRDAYIEAYRETWRKVDRPGCRGVQILSCIEHPGRVIVQISWDSVEAHEQARHLPGHEAIRELRTRFEVRGEGYAHYTIDQV